MIMKYKNKIQTARKKYLEAEVLSENDRNLIDRDLAGKDYINFLSDNQNFILPEKYSAETTYQLINEKIVKANRDLKFANIIRYTKYAAAIIVIALISTYVYKYVLSPPEMIYASTSYGERKEVMLPDGSIVILNSLSQLSYPEKMDGDTREVSLNGEAYFDVIKNPQKTFIVNVKDLDIKVLGTKFNIEAYETQESITTTLFEGAVSVNLDNGYTKQLEPGQQATYNKIKNEIDVQSPANIDGKLEWQTGILTFENEKLFNILDVLGREHNVSFDISDNQLKQLRVTVRFNAKEPIETVLAIIGESANFSFIKQGNIYKITAK